MSDTPRTDAMELEIELGQSAPYKMKYLARELERENAALHDEVVKANGLLDMQMKELAKLREALSFYSDPQTYGLNGGSLKRILSDAGFVATSALRKEAQP